MLRMPAVSFLVRKKDLSDDLSTNTPDASFKQFFIPKGDHYATDNQLKPVETAE